MHAILRFTAGFFGMGLLTLSARTFTSTAGKTLEGEIREANDKEVTIKRLADGKEVRIPLDSLIPADVAEVTAWRERKALSKLVVTATKDKETSVSQTGGTGTLVDNKDQTWTWVITVKNASAQPVSGLKLDYAQVVERTNRNQSSRSGAAKTVIRRANSTMMVPDIPAFGSVQLKTAPITVQSFKSVDIRESRDTSGDRVTKVTSNKWDEALSGLAVAIFHGDERVLRWKTGTDPGGNPGAPRE